MKISTIALACAAALLVSTSAQAQVSVAADIGTTGIGFTVSVPMESNLYGRFGIHYGSLSASETAGSVSYNVKTKIKNVDILFDWYLFEGSKMHLTGGVVLNKNRIDAYASPNADNSYLINGVTYTAADVGTLTGRIDFRNASPYLGIGYGHIAPEAGKWRMVGDLGVIMQGAPKVNLVSRGCVTSPTVCNKLVTDVNAERVKFAADIDSFKFYPVLRVGAAYTF